MNDENKECEAVRTPGGVLRFSRGAWPKCGTVVPAMPADLNELWDGREDQAAVFVAEAILCEPPDSALNFDQDEATILVFVWSVGGDTMTLDISLSETIESGVQVYDKIRSPAQEEDVRLYIPKLEKVEGAIVRAKAFLQGQLDDYAKMQKEQKKRKTKKLKTNV